MARQPEEKAAAKFSKDDSALIRELALLLDETSLTEIEIERAGLRLRVARNVTIAASMPANFAPAGAAATATDAPTIGLLPMPIKPIISTCAGTEDDPANCASECIRPMVSVMP